MRTDRNVPTLQILPPPPPEKEGWPWTKETSSILDRYPDDYDWPVISIVTPSFNQGKFIEETIRSVLLQGYPNLEYIVIDGGSNDNSLDIIRKYEPWISYWISEPDRGQSHAINKGLKRATGTILAWLNSDDLLQSNTLYFVAKTLTQKTNPAWLIGASAIIDRDSKISHYRYPNKIEFENLLNWHENWFPQQSTFWNYLMWQSVNPLDENLHYVMDFALWLAMIQKAKPITTQTVLSCYRYQPDAKCMKNAFKVWYELFNCLIEVYPKIKKENFKSNLVYPFLTLANIFCFYEKYTMALKCLQFSYQQNLLFGLNIKNLILLGKILIKILIGKNKYQTARDFLKP